MENVMAGPGKVFGNDIIQGGISVIANDQTFIESSMSASQGVVKSIEPQNDSQKQDGRQEANGLEPKIEINYFTSHLNTSH